MSDVTRKLGRYRRTNVNWIVSLFILDEAYFSRSERQATLALSSIVELLCQAIQRSQPSSNLVIKRATQPIIMSLIRLQVVDTSAGRRPSYRSSIRSCASAYVNE